MDKRPLGIKIIGISAVLYGIWCFLIRLLIYIKLVPHLVKWYNDSSVLEELLRLRFITFVFPLISIILYFLMVTGGIGLLQSKRWGRSLILGVSSILIYLFIGGFFIFGLCRSNFSIISIIIGIFIYIVVVIYLKRNTIQNNFFGLSRKSWYEKKKLYLILPVISMLLPVLIYIGQISKIGLENVFYQPKLISYTPKDSSSLPENYQKQHFLGYSIYIPSEFQIGTRKPDEDLMAAWVSSDKNKSIIIFKKNFIFDHVAPIFGFEDSYNFGKKFIREKIGIVPLILRTLPGRFDEVNFGDWRGFVLTRVTNEKCLVSYSLWNKGRRVSLDISFSYKNDYFNSEEIANIVSSLQVD